MIFEIIVYILRLFWIIRKVEYKIITWKEWKSMGFFNRRDILNKIDDGIFDVQILCNIPHILRDAYLPYNYHSIYYQCMDDDCSIISNRPKKDRICIKKFANNHFYLCIKSILQLKVNYSKIQKDVFGFIKDGYDIEIIDIPKFEKFYSVNFVIFEGVEYINNKINILYPFQQVLNKSDLVLNNNKLFIDNIGYYPIVFHDNTYFSIKNF